MLYLSIMTAMRLMLIICLATAVTVSSYTSGKPACTGADNGFAFVELFTSEGCSSCPSAEKLVEKLVDENSNRVYLVSYHVDYWDRLGWKDQFSKRDYSVHQYEYAKQFHLTSVYTPQIVVNGQSEFLGSNEIALRSAIHSKINNKERAHITLSRLETDADKCTIHYSLDDAETPAGLTFVLVEKRAVTNVKAGENNGKMLEHVNIVRDVKDLPAGKFSGDFSVALPKDIGKDNWDLICYAKNRLNGEILSVRSIKECSK